MLYTVYIAATLTQLLKSTTNFAKLNLDIYLYHTEYKYSTYILHTNFFDIYS